MSTEKRRTQTKGALGDLDNRPREIEMLLTAGWGSKWSKSLTAEELLEISRKALEPLFHTPPLGPVPEYLQPHSSVHGCVTEYEEKLEELQRWKVSRLSCWLKSRVGKKYRAGEKVYVLYAERGEPNAPVRYGFKLSEEWT